MRPATTRPAPDVSAETTMTSEPGDRRSIRAFVTATAIVGAVALGAVALLESATPVHWPTVGALFVAAILSVRIPLRFSHRGGIQGFTFEEAVLIAALLTLPAAIAPLLVTAAALVGHLVLRRDLLKVAFNVGQVALWTTAATLTFHAVGAGDEVFIWRSVAAVVAATVVSNLVSIAIVGELFRRLDGRRVLETVREVWRLNVVTWLSNVGFGLLLAYAARADVAATVLAALVIVALYVGYRGYAATLAGRDRAAMLDRLTRTLVDGPRTRRDVGAFLAQVTELFGGDGAELVLLDGPEAHSFRFGRSGAADATATVDARAMAAEAVRRQAAVLIGDHDGALSDALRRGGHHDALVAPLTVGGATIGALAVYDRHGVEPWERTDATMLGSLARMAAGFVTAATVADPAPGSSPGV